MSHLYTHVTHETLGNRLMALLVERQTTPRYVGVETM
jgi:hypothetical protein